MTTLQLILSCTAIASALGAFFSVTCWLGNHVDQKMALCAARALNAGGEERFSGVTEQDRYTFLRVGR